MLTRNLQFPHFPSLVLHLPEHAQCVYSVHIDGVRVYMHVRVSTYTCPALTRFAWLCVLQPKHVLHLQVQMCPVCDDVCGNWGCSAILR